MVYHDFFERDFAAFMNGTGVFDAGLGGRLCTREFDERGLRERFNPDRAFRVEGAHDVIVTHCLGRQAKSQNKKSENLNSRTRRSSLNSDLRIEFGDGD